MFRYSCLEFNCVFLVARRRTGIIRDSPAWRGSYAVALVLCHLLRFRRSVCFGGISGLHALESKELAQSLDTQLDAFDATGSEAQGPTHIYAHRGLETTNWLGCRYLLLCRWLLLEQPAAEDGAPLVCGEEQSEAKAAMLLDAAAEVLLEGHNVVGDAGDPGCQLHKRST